MKKNHVRAAALAGLIGASLMASTAEASPTTVNFSFLAGSTTIADGSLTYLNPGPITSFSGFSAFNITFHNGALTDSFVLSQLIGLPPANQFVDFDTTTNQFAFTPDPIFFNIPMALRGINGGSIYFFIFDNGGLKITDNVLNLYNAEITDVSYIAKVPEPASVAMFGAGMLVLGLVARRRKKI